MRNFYRLFLIIFIFVLVLTFSRAAILGLIFGIVFYLKEFRVRVSYKKVAFYLLSFLAFITLIGLLPVLFQRFFVFDVNSFSERVLFLDIARSMFKEHVFGVGAGNFTAVMQSFTDLKLLPWLYQPVHNVYLLLFAELGFFGGVLFIGLIFYILFLFLVQKSGQKIRIALPLTLFLLFVAFFDHYFISLYQGQALLWIYFSLISQSVD